MGRTTFAPFIASCAIGDSKGRTHYFPEGDFRAFERYIFDGVFGNITKYVKLNLEGVTEEQYDKAIKDADEKFKTLECVSWLDSTYHVAEVLNNLKYNGHSNHSIWSVWLMGCT